jgi:hypothetical protein
LVTFFFSFQKEKKKVTIAGDDMQKKVHDIPPVASQLSALVYKHKVT